MRIFALHKAINFVQKGQERLELAGYVRLRPGKAAKARPNAAAIQDVYPLTSRSNASSRDSLTASSLTEQTGQ